MPEKVVEVPGLGNISFPDDMSDDAIAAAIKGQMAPHVTAGTGHTGDRLKGVPKGLPNTFMGTLAGDVAAVPETAYNLVRHPINSIGNIAQGIADLPENLATDISQGNIGKLGARAVEMGLPALGKLDSPSLARAGTAVKGAAKGGAKAFISGKSSFPALGFGALGEMTGIPHAGPVMGGLAALPGTLEGMWSGAKEALAPPPIRPLEPFRPNPALARKMPFTPFTPDYGAPGTNIPRGSFTPPAEAAPASMEPFKINPVTAKRMQFGGPTEPGYSAPGTTIPRGNYTPPVAESPAIEPIKPFKPNPNIMRNIKGTPAGGEPGMPTSTGRNIPRKGYVPPVEEANLPANTTPVEGEATMSGSSPLAPIDKFEMNRLAHARAQEVELPGSPAGKSGHAQLSKAALDNFGVKSWSDLSVGQMRQIHDFIDKFKRAPAKGDLK